MEPYNYKLNDWLQEGIYVLPWLLSFYSLEDIQNQLNSFK